MSMAFRLTLIGLVIAASGCGEESAPADPVPVNSAPSKHRTSEEPSATKRLDDAKLGVKPKSAAETKSQTARASDDDFIAVVQLPREPFVPNPKFDFQNSIGMKFVTVPAGEFDMGSEPRELIPVANQDSKYTGRFSEGERPRHRVKMTKPFLMSIYETTLGEFKSFIDATGFRTSAEDPRSSGRGAHGWNEKKNNYDIREKEYSWKYTGFPQSENHPVGNVSRDDALAFCKWLSKKEGRTYRLPTEAEWEYACRAGTTSLFHNGDSIVQIVEVANLADASYARKMSQLRREFAHVSADDEFVFSAPVGMFHPNAWGLFDMHGNVSEHCADIYSPTYYERSPKQDPQGPEDYEVYNNVKLLRRVKRGGSWKDAPGDLRSANRSYGLWKFRFSYLGFRVVVDIPATSETDRKAADADQ